MPRKGAFLGLGSPAADKPVGQLVDPLAVVEHNQSGTLRRPQGIEKAGQGVESSQLTRSFRSRDMLLGSTQNVGQTRQGSAHGGRLISQTRSNGRYQLWIGLGDSPESLGN